MKQLILHIGSPKTGSSSIQLSLNMSKKLLKNTNNDFMIYLAYRIIRSQQDEIILLNDLSSELK